MSHKTQIFKLKISRHLRNLAL